MKFHSRFEILWAFSNKIFFVKSDRSAEETVEKYIKRLPRFEVLQSFAATSKNDETHQQNLKVPKGSKKDWVWCKNAGEHEAKKAQKRPNCFYEWIEP